MAACKAGVRPAPILVTAAETGALPGDVRISLSRLAAEGERNAVLNLTETAVRGIFARDQIPPKLQTQVIDQALDEAMNRIEAVYADTPEARKARSVWHDEATKDFKGEPYERAFVFLLRGLRYYEAGDFENARACFMSGILQDRLSVEGEHNADMATFEYLIALCNLKLGERETAAEALTRARALRSGIPEPRADDNLLVVVLAGQGPRKTQIGPDKEILLIERGVTRTNRIEVCVPWIGQAPDYRMAAQTDDMAFQATTRGGRLVDEINKRKATTKRATDTAGDIAIDAGMATLMFADSDEAAAIGAALLIAGLVAKGAASAMKTQADIRTIKSVPGFIHLWAGRILPGDQLFAVRLYDGSGEEIADSYHDVAIPFANNHVIVYLRTP